MAYSGDKIKHNPTLPLLEQEITDIVEQHEQDIVNIIRIERGKKTPSDKGWINKKLTTSALKKHTGNFGLIVGYNHEVNGYSVAVVDIDGIGEKGSKKRQIVQQRIFNDLKDIPNTLQVKTQSGGYHIYFLNKTQYHEAGAFHRISQSLYFPMDFEIEELRGESLGHSIEIFTQNKQTVLPSSIIIDENTGKKIGEYAVVGEKKSFSDIEPISDINQIIKTHLVSKGYTFKEPTIENSQYETLKTSYQAFERKNKSLNADEVNDLSDLLRRCYTQGHKNHSKHEMTLAVSGICDKYLDDDSIAQIEDNIIANNGAGYILDDVRAFSNTLWVNVDKKTTKKAGIPTLKRLLVETGLSEHKTDELIRNIYNIIGDKYEHLKDGRGNNCGLTVPLLSESDKYRLTKELSAIIDNSDEVLQIIISILASKGIALNDIEEICQELYQDADIIKKMVYEDWNKSNKDMKEEKKEIEKQIDFIVRDYAPVKLRKIRNKGYNQEKFNPREIADYLNKHCGVAINDIDELPIIYNPQYNRYDTISHKQLYKMFVQDILQIPNCIAEQDIYDSVQYITDWVTPNWNVIGLKNCNYDFETHEAIDKFPKPTFPAFTFDWNYNPYATPSGDTNIIQFLKTSLKGETETETNKNVRGLLEIIGYYLKAGNERQIVVNCVGVGGSGKGTLEKIITSLFGVERTSNVGVQEYEEEFGRSSLIGSWINIDTDATSETLKKCSYFKKSISDPLKIERKFKEPVVLPPNAVPKNMIMSNRAVKFNNESNLFGKFIIIEFLHSYRNTSKVVLNYDKIITENQTDMEWLLYNSLQAFKEMDTAENGEFIYRLSNDETERKMIKYQDPVGYILRTLIEPAEDDEITDHHIVFISDLDNAVKKTGEEMGLEVPITPSGKVSKLKKAITEMIDVPANQYDSKKEFGKRHYPNVKWLNNQTRWFFDK